MKKRRKKNSPFNWAICLMVITTICLCSIQYGYSFFNQNFLFGGQFYIQASQTTPAIDNIISNNQQFFVDSFVNDLAPDASNLGFNSILRAPAGSEMNNYIKFSENATEVWRILGFTDDSIKIIRAEALTVAELAWSADRYRTHWVELETGTSYSSSPISFNFSSITQANTSDLCYCLNVTYYNEITNASNVNYINPLFINSTEEWDLTPMAIDDNTRVASFVSGSKAGDLTITGLPIGLPSITELCLISSAFSADVADGTYSTYTSCLGGWGNLDIGAYELTITEVVEASDYSDSNPLVSVPSPSGDIVCMRRNQLHSGNKTSAERPFRPMMYLYSDLITFVSGDGSEDNPFIVGAWGGQ